MGRVKHRFSVATGRSARISGHFRAGAGGAVVAPGASAVTAVRRGDLGARRHAGWSGPESKTPSLEPVWKVGKSSLTLHFRHLPNYANRSSILPARRRTGPIKIFTSRPNLATSSSILASLTPRNCPRVMRDTFD